MKEICHNELKKIEVEDLKRLQLDILDFVVSFCEENRIKYWLDSGTLLGAIRHKGYIPWDDDIDIGMLREDFDKFKSIFKDPNGRFVFRNIETDKDFHYAFGKVLDTKTVLYEPDINGHKICVYIDVFVYDNAIDLKDANKRYRIRDWLRFFSNQRYLRVVCKGNLLRKIIIGAFRVLLRIFPKTFFVRKIARNSKKYMKRDTKYVGNFTAHAKMICEKDVFDHFITAEFEGKTYKIPAGYDRWLKAFYGDYMQLPPEGKRVSHHSFEAFMKE